MRVVVTGAGGLLGKRIVEVFKRDHEVIGVYNSSKPLTEKFLITDLSKLENVRKIEELSPDVVIHAAALTDVDKCEENPELAKRLNYEVTREISKINSFIVYISTDYVFDGNRGNYKEEDETNPINVYGMTKLMGEEAVRSSSNYLIVRTSTPYGSNPASKKDNFALWLLKKLSAKEEVRIVVDQFTSPTFNTNFALMLKESVDKKMNNMVIHLSDSTRISKYDFAVKLAKTFGYDESLIKPIKMDELKWKAKRPMDSSLNVEKASKLLNNKPLNVDDALKLLKREIESAS
ncbi:dTDP-4-dehydrorhamnose reductase [Acidianus sulfidivorans JP7]|uniref:dTDP-4-dehydrorhamnose reductase n=1 Tax=Acidianus sulfidivorans JP7 TaxID=619593 RepID=A0A2U9IQ68_9CREN|nr:dTDP-4-dehydrorhamnose reductase [Acidianus sulfidivorans JP7]